MTATASTTDDVVYRTFEVAAERIGDLVDPVYERYFARDPEAAALMEHMDQLTRGRMLTEVVRLLMSWSGETDGPYLDFEVRNHQQAYRVHERMYGELLTAVREVVAEALDSDWDADCAAAWNERVGQLVDEIHRRAEAA
jgi:hypothetical protein